MHARFVLSGWHQNIQNQRPFTLLRDVQPQITHSDVTVPDHMPAPSGLAVQQSRSTLRSSARTAGGPPVQSFIVKRPARRTGDPLPCQRAPGALSVAESFVIRPGSADCAQSCTWSHRQAANRPHKAQANARGRVLEPTAFAGQDRRPSGRNQNRLICAPGDLAPRQARNPSHAR
jgi:hypothetical protein